MPEIDGSATAQIPGSATSEALRVPIATDDVFVSYASQDAAIAIPPQDAPAGIPERRRVIRFPIPAVRAWQLGVVGGH
jgi:hypothetical protein